MSRVVCVFKTRATVTRTFRGVLPEDVREGDLALATNEELFEWTQDLEVDVDEDDEELVPGTFVLEEVV